MNVSFAINTKKEHFNQFIYSQTLRHGLTEGKQYVQHSLQSPVRHRNLHKRPFCRVRGQCLTVIGLAPMKRWRRCEAFTLQL